MKKKHLQSIFIFGIILTFNGFVLGQTSTDIGMINGVPNDPALQAAKINFIDAQFCSNGTGNPTSKLLMTIKAGEEKEICLLIGNRDDKDANLVLGFTDSAIYNGSYDCGTDYTRNNAFSKFMKPIENSIKVPARGHVILKTTIKFPIGVEGIQNGCFAYSVGENVVGGQFSFVTRKRAIINILVEGDTEIENKIKINKITSKIDKNKKLGIEFNIENNGSIDEIIDIEGEFSSPFGYKKNFFISGTIINVNKNTTINTTDLGVDFEIPRYKGPFTIKLKINYKPYFDFDVSQYGFDINKLGGSTITQTKTIFMFPVIPLIGLLVFLILIYLAFFKKPKIIIQQASTASEK